MEIITIEKTELIELIDTAVTRAVERALSPPDAATQRMSTQQLCEYLGVSRSTVNRYMKQGMPHDAPPGGRPTFKKTQVDAWLGRN